MSLQRKLFDLILIAASIISGVTSILFYLAGYLINSSPPYTPLQAAVTFVAVTVLVTAALTIFVLIPFIRYIGRVVDRVAHVTHAIRETFEPTKEELQEAQTSEGFFHEERLNRMSMSLQSIIDEIKEGMEATSFAEIRGILSDIHSAMTIVSSQQENLAAHAEEIIAMNSDINRINAQLHRREIIWSSLLEINQSITSTLNFRTGLKQVLTSVRNVTQAYGIGLMILENDTLVSLLFTGYQEANTNLENLSLPLDEASLAKRAINTHVVQWNEDVAEDPEYREIDPNVRSEVTIPLYQGAQVLGVMNISFNRRYRRSDEFMEMISPVAASLSGYVSSWRSHREIRSSYEYLILKFQEIADIYHHETASHLVRVGRYSAMAAAWVGCSPQDQRDITIFSRAHDLGKIRVPVDIVLKPTGLILEEFEIMKKHTIWGAELIGDAEWLTMARNICASHHERWNGSGYPYALKGKNIPLEARIVALVDIYDALRSPRSYKDGYTHEEAVIIILEGDGRTLPEHFDPNLWEFFRRNHEEMSKIFDETRDQ